MTLDQLISDNPTLTDTEIVTLANAPTITLKPALVRFRTLDMMFPADQCYQIETALAATITALLATPDDDPAVLAKRGMGSRLRRAQSYMQGTADSDGIDVGDASVRADVAAMVGSVLTAEQAAAILAMGETRTYIDGAPGITEADVAAARERIARLDLRTQFFARVDAAAAYLNVPINDATAPAATMEAALEIMAQEA